MKDPDTYGDNFTTIVRNIELRIRIENKSDPETKIQGHEVELTIKWLQIRILCKFIYLFK